MSLLQIDVRERYQQLPSARGELGAERREDSTTFKEDPSEMMSKTSYCVDCVSTYYYISMNSSTLVTQAQFVTRSSITPTTGLRLGGVMQPRPG